MNDPSVEELKRAEEISAAKEDYYSYSSISPRRAPREYISAPLKGNSIAQLNRHTGLPHEHKREIKRRLKTN